MNSQQHQPQSRYDLQRFVNAQLRNDTFNVALGEIRNGRKETHWIWYVFPQLFGLRTSTMCNFFGLRGIGEAKAYLRNRFLRENLRTIGRALLKHMGTPAIQILGEIDAEKVHACATLFYRAAQTKIDRELFKGILDAFYGGQEEPLTLTILEGRRLPWSFR